MDKNNDNFLSEIYESTSSIEIIDVAEVFVPNIMKNIKDKFWNEYKEYKIKQFIKGISISIQEDDFQINNKAFFNKMMSNKKDNYIFNKILDEALHTSSDYTSLLIGIIAGEVLRSDDDINYKNTLIITGLKNINDYDLKFLKQTYKYFSEPKNINKHGVNATAIFFNTTMSHIENESNLEEEINKNSELKIFKSSLHKLSSLQLLDTGGLYMTNDANSFSPNEFGKYIINMLNNILKGN